MMKKALFTATAVAVSMAAIAKPDYKKASLPVEKRVEDLMSRMTLEEKIGQMSQYVGLNHIRETSAKFKGKVEKNNDANGMYPNLSISELEKMTREGLVGSFLHVLTAEEANELQKMAKESRLGIPLIIGIDAIHGNAMVSGTTVYPTPITQAAAFDRELAYEASKQTASEMRATGSHWTFTPNIDIARDARWGRVGETYGEDPYLVTELGVATIKGLQGDKIGKNDVLACAKHLIGGGESSNGLNAAPFDISERSLREFHLPPYRAAVEDCNVFTIMAAHNEINGTPCHSSDWLMNDIMRGEYGFNGFFVSDWLDVYRVHTIHRAAPTLNDAIALSVNGGIDMNMHGPDFYFGLLEMVEEGKVSEERIDAAVRPILEAKFRLGLFENPLVNEKKIEDLVFTEEHQATALAMAENGIVLLENKNSILPLDLSKYGKILVTGPNANSDAILGDWTLQQPAEKVTTILEGIQEVAGDKVVFADYGTEIKPFKPALVNEIAAKAKNTDLAIVVVGENPLRYENKSKTTGENIDRMNLDLLGSQQELIEKIHATGVPTIVVLVGGRPLSVNWAAENADALIQAWEPGSFAGKALANILTGKVNPSAKLPISMPRHSGQIQMIYNHKPSQYFHTYKDGPSTPLYDFGYGLSYTTYAYSQPKVSKAVISDDENVEVTVDVTNTGKRKGTEIVQLYIHDQYSTFTRPIKELKDFTRVELNPGETKTVTFTVTPDKLAYFNSDMEFEVEPGTFEIMVGSSSNKKDLKNVVIEVK